MEEINSSENIKVNPHDQTKNYLNISTSTNSSSKIPFAQLNQEIENEIQDDSYFEEEAKKTNLFFEEKNISPFKLYFHLSNSYEIILMILGTICSLGAGFGGPFLCYLFGNMANDFSDANIDENQREFLKILMLNCTNEEEAKALAKGDYDRAWAYGKIYTFASAKFATFNKNINILVKQQLIIGILMFFTYGGSKFFWCYCGLRQMHHLKEKYFALILKQEQGWFDSNNAYEFSTKVQAQFEQIGYGIGEKFGILLRTISQIIFGFIVSFYKSWLLSVVMLAVSPIIFVCFISLGYFLRKPMIGSRKAYEKAGGAAEEMLYNIKTIVSFSNFDFEINRFNKFINLVHYFNRKSAIILGSSIGSGLFFTFSSFFVALMYSRKLIGEDIINTNSGTIFTLGDIETVLLATLISLASIGLTAPIFPIIQESAIASSDYFTLYERKPQMDFSQSIEKPPKDNILGKIEFKNVNFYYPSDPNKRMILKNMNLVMESGKKIAIVGESGCGKSTIVNLIERLYEVSSGQVLIDGIDIKKYDLSYIRNFIGYVQQEPVLFNTSIRDNLFFGRNEYVKTLGDPESLMKEACADAYAKEFIEMKQEKYDYVVGIKGGKLSGGQKQRLAIARAILCKPKILILDEATSALDNKSEKEVQAALDHISEKSVTTVIIAHRLSTIKNADVIYALKGGKVHEKGTHKELLEKNGYYASLVKSQLAQDELESKEENISPMQKKMSKMSSERKMTLQRMSRKSSRYSSNLDTKTQLKEIEKEKEIKIERGRIFSLISDHKGETFIGGLGAFIGGAISPVQGFVMSKAINALSSTNPKTVKDDGLLWGLMFLVVAFVNGISLFFKIWKLETIGSVITSKMRKLIIDKYLHLHIGFFDEDENAPGSLLTRLSIDTTQLNTLVLSVVGDLVGTLGTAAVGLGLSFYFSWRLTLISICFLPFIIYAQIIIAKTRRGGREEDKKIDIEAGGVLSECVINTKTIYSFNFQKPAVNMYLQILYEAEKKFFKDSFIKGIVCGLGVFAMYASNATVFHFSGVFIRKGKLSFQDMNSAMNCVITMSQGISQGLVGVSEYTKAKKAFSSVFSTMDTKTLIDPSEEGNKGKITPENLKGKIEFKNVTFAYPTRPDQ